MKRALFRIAAVLCIALAAFFLITTKRSLVSWRRRLRR